MTTATDVNEAELELTEAEENLYYHLILNPDKRRTTRAFIRQGGNRRQDHGSKGNSNPKGWNSFIGSRNYRYRYDDAELIINRRVFRTAGRRITGNL